MCIPHIYVRVFSYPAASSVFPWAELFAQICYLLQPANCPQTVLISLPGRAISTSKCLTSMVITNFISGMERGDSLWGIETIRVNLIIRNRESRGQSKKNHKMAFRRIVICMPGVLFHVTHEDGQLSCMVGPSMSTYTCSTSSLLLFRLIRSLDWTTGSTPIGTWEKWEPSSFSFEKLN